MAEGVEPTETELEIARNGIMTQLRSHCSDFAELAEGDLEQALSELNEMGLKGFIDNQVEVIASQRAYIRSLNNIINEGLAS